MKIKTKSVISVLLIFAMVVSVAAFTSCADGEKEETIMVNVKVTGSNGVEESNDLSMTGVPDDLTVLSATKRFCEEVLQIDFVYDEHLNSVIQIGPDTLDKNAIKDAVGEEVTSETEAVETSETAEGETTEQITESDGTYYDWQGYVNGVAAKPADKIKDGDKIEWKWEKFEATVG